MLKINKEAKNYLKNFIENNNRKALLIKGDQGSGKTFLIKSFVENIKKDKKYRNYKFINIDLWGLNTLDDVKKKITFYLKREYFFRYYFIVELSYFLLFIIINIFISLNINIILLIFIFLPFIDEMKKINSRFCCFYFFNKDNIIFIFNNVDTINIDTNKLFGFLNRLIESYSKNKIILIY